MDQVKARMKKAVVVLACIAVFYAGSYACLSGLGRYEPIAFDLHGVMWSSWAPEGFVREPQLERGKVTQSLKWREPLMIIYLPLLALDWRLWHRNFEPGEKTKYPVDGLFERAGSHR